MVFIGSLPFEHLDRPRTLVRSSDANRMGETKLLTTIIVGVRGRRCLRVDNVRGLLSTGPKSVVHASALSERQAGQPFIATCVP
jgi:hypothetical protein